MMSCPMTAPEILDREFLEMRAKILELAASLDRLDRGDDEVEGDSRMQLLRDGLQILLGENSNRAARVQMLFSRTYKESWRDEFKLEPRFSAGS